MGVRGLWEVVGPVAKPIQLESLRRQRLAVDASIWIYQFLKAVRDSEGNVVKYAHIVGFFRRICKLLFFGIKPVFVFDGAAPELKRITVNRRRERREGHRENLNKTAARLLTMQMHQQSKLDKKNDNKRKRNDHDDNTEEYNNYYDERNVASSERHNAKKAFRPQDQYHLPEVDELGKLVTEDDPRLMTQDELKEYADEFQDQLNSLEGGLVDTMQVDFDSPDFKMLPLATQYQLINTARLRSRLRMGYTHQQLDEHFTDRMEFSKFQINRVAQRNYLTQKIMDITGMDEKSASGHRIAGEKGGEYILNRNDETGWTLALDSSKYKANKPVELDSDGEEKQSDNDDESDEEDMEWESVDIGQSKPEPIKVEEAPMVESLPEELQGFEDKVQRQRLYEQLQEQAALEDLFEEKKNEQAPKIIDRPHNMPFLFKGDLDLSQLGNNKNQPSTSAEKKEKKNFTDLNFESSSLFGNLGSGASTLTVGTDSPKPAAKFHSETAATPPPVPDQNKDQQSESESDKEPPVSAAPLPPWFEQQQKQASASAPAPATEKEKEKEKDKDEAEENVKEGLAEQRRLQRELDEEQGIEHESEEEEEEVVDDNVVVVEEQKADQNTASALRVKPPLPEIETIERLEPEKEEPDKELDEGDKQLAQEEAEYEDEENEQLVDKMLEELEESQRFAKSLNTHKTASTSTTMGANYSAEIERLKKQQHNHQRDSDQVSSTMVEECQQLLQLFGIPYITAPTEAEAQCAKLVELGLVDGVVTDDSDCFLFGGNKIYKNFFNQAKWVERYDSEDVDREFGLDRTKLIDLAQLLGSDYTDGIVGVGPVQGLELLAEFEGDLQRFRDWWVEEQKRIKPGPELSDFQRKFRQRHLSKIFLPDSFPDHHVKHAYLQPQVDDDPTEFEWGKPDLDKLRRFLTTSTGWSQERIDEMLVPVIRDMNKPPSREPMQTTLTDHVGFSPLERIELGHKRMHKAVQKLRHRSDTH